MLLEVFAKNTVFYKTLFVKKSMQFILIMLWIYKYWSIFY